MRTILVTGGSGFVGSNLSIYFKENNPGSRVVVLDNLRRRGSEFNLSRLKEAGVEFIHGDIRNKEDLEIVGPFDLMIECSAEPSVAAGYNESPEYLINTNLIGTINCLEVLRKYKADIIFLSTSRVYPTRLLNEIGYDELETRFEVKPNQGVLGLSELGISEEFPITGTRSLYGASKLASEFLIQEYIEAYGIRGVINRCSVITGPWQMGKIDQGVVALWVGKHIYGGKLSYIGYGGKGKQVRDILHIYDLCDLLALQVSQIDIFNGQIYNIGGGYERSVSLCELSFLCERITGNKIGIGSLKENRVADIPYYISNCTKIFNATGWYPKISVEKIIQDLADWFNANKNILKNTFG